MLKGMKILGNESILKLSSYEMFLKNLENKFIIYMADPSTMKLFSCVVDQIHERMM